MKKSPSHRACNLYRSIVFVFVLLRMAFDVWSMISLYRIPDDFFINGSGNGIMPGAMPPDADMKFVRRELDWCFIADDTETPAYAYGIPNRLFYFSMKNY